MGPPYVNSPLGSSVSTPRAAPGPPPEVILGRHENTKIAQSVDYLKALKGAPIRSEDLALAIGWDELIYSTLLPDSPTQALAQLITHPRVIHDSKTNLLSYKTDFNLGSKEEVYNTVKLNKDKVAGVSVKMMNDSWPGTRAAIDELEAEGQVLVMRVKGAKEGPAKQVFLNEITRERGGKPVSAEFRKLWDSFTVPEDIKKALAQSDLQESNIDPDSVTAMPVQGKKKGRKSGARKVKITNVHMLDHNIDLSRDRVDLTGNNPVRR